MLHKHTYATSCLLAQGKHDIFDDDDDLFEMVLSFSTVYGVDLFFS